MHRRFEGNPDDDDEVETFKENELNRAAKRAHKKYEREHAGMSEEAMLQMLEKAVGTVMRNIDEGDCPELVGSVDLFVDADPDGLRSPGAVQIILGPAEDSPSRLTWDARLLAGISDESMWMTDPDVPKLPPLLRTVTCGMQLGSSPGMGYGAPTPEAVFGRKGMDAAVVSLVNHCIQHRIVHPNDAPRLIRKWTTWWQGVPWRAAQLTYDNRPSLASRVGFPWESSYQMETPDRLCGLRRGLDATEIQALNVFQRYPHELADVTAAERACFVRLKSAQGGCAARVALRRSLDAGKAYLAELRSKTKSKSKKRAR